MKVRVKSEYKDLYPEKIYDICILVEDSKQFSDTYIILEGNYKGFNISKIRFEVCKLSFLDEIERILEC